MCIRPPQALQKLESFCQNKLWISKLLTIMFLSMFDVHCWKFNNICNTWKINKKLNILMWFTCLKDYIIYFILLLKFLDCALQKNYVQNQDFVTLLSISVSKIFNPLYFGWGCMPRYSRKVFVLLIFWVNKDGLGFL